jgi:hypothetical protein
MPDLRQSTGKAEKGQKRARKGKKRQGVQK